MVTDVTNEEVLQIERSAEIRQVKGNRKTTLMLSIEEHFYEDKNYVLKMWSNIPEVTKVKILKTDRIGFFVEVEVGYKFTFVVYVRVTSKSSPCHIRELAFKLKKDKEKPAAFQMVLAPFISHGADSCCCELGVSYMDRQGNYNVNFSILHGRQTGFFPYIKNHLPSIYDGPRNKRPRPW